MIRKLLLIVLICISPSMCFSQNRNIHVEWGYTPPTAPKVIGFKLYQEGTFVCDFPGESVTNGDCSVNIVNSTTNFTLTALFADGTESPQSSVFAFKYDASKDKIIIIFAM